MMHAEQWAQSMRLRSAAYTGIESQAAIQKMIRALDIDYPNQCFNLVNSADAAGVIGVRRVFGDRSYCDLLFANADTGKIEFGVLSAGLLGTAQNGRAIIH